MMTWAEISEAIATADFTDLESSAAALYDDEQELARKYGLSPDEAAYVAAELARINGDR